jgi:hypothetical protein
MGIYSIVFLWASYTHNLCSFQYIMYCRVECSFIWRYFDLFRFSIASIRSSKQYDTFSDRKLLFDSKNVDGLYVWSPTSSAISHKPDTRRCQSKARLRLHKAELDSVLASASASSVPWIPQCPGSHTNWNLLDKASSWRESPQCITTLADTAYYLRASKVAILSEQIDIALLTMPSEMKYSEHAKIA